MRRGQKTLRAVKRILCGKRVSAPRVEHPVCHDLKAWAASWGGAEYVVLEAAGTTTRPRPKTIEPEVHASFAPLYSFPVPERALVTVPNGKIRGRYGLVILPNGEFAGELVAMTPEGRHAMLRAEPSYFEPLPTRPVRKKGRFYSLLGFGVNNYYHFTHDILMRMRGITDRLPSDTQLLVPEKMTRFQLDTLDVLGLDAHPRVPFPADELWELERLYVVKPISKTQIDSAEHFRWYRKLAMDRQGVREGVPTKRLFVTRRNDRYWRATNEEEVESFLSSRGFETVSPGELSFREQIELFAQGEIIVGTGAGMTNMVFSPPGTKVLQLQENNHFVHTAWTMAAALGFDYHYFLCDIVPNPGQPAVDIHVPIAKLEASLAQMSGV